MRQYSITISLIYNMGDLRTREDDSAFIMGLGQDVVWEESIEEIASEKMRFSLSCGWQNEEKKVPERHFQLRIENMIAENSAKAQRMVEKQIDHICKILSLEISIHNANKQGYQPRVQPDWSSAEWQDVEYMPIEQVQEDEGCDDYIDENGRHVIRMKINSGVVIHNEVSSYITIYGCLPEGEFLDYYRRNLPDEAEFALEEYYIALGTERMTSKFFHLFSIIEMIEREYIALADAEQVFSAEDIDRIVEKVAELFEGKKRDRLKGVLTSNLSRVTDMGRSEKLKQILHKMGITEVQHCGEKIAIEKKMLQELIDLRNGRFHGEIASENSKKISVALAVEELMEICQGVIQYMMKEQ